MINNTFFIVVREKRLEGFKDVREVSYSVDQWGWEFADNIERLDYLTAKKDREEYQVAMPSHVVRIRAVPTDKNRYDYNENLKPKV